MLPTHALSLLPLRVKNSGVNLDGGGTTGTKFIRFTNVMKLAAQMMTVTNWTMVSNSPTYTAWAATNELTLEFSEARKKSF